MSERWIQQNTGYWTWSSITLFKIQKQPFISISTYHKVFNIRRTKSQNLNHAGESLRFLASYLLCNGSWAPGSVPGGSATASLPLANKFSVKTWKIWYSAVQSATQCRSIPLGKYIVEQMMHPLAFNLSSLSQMKAHKCKCSRCSETFCANKPLLLTVH